MLTDMLGNLRLGGLHFQTDNGGGITQTNENAAGDDPSADDPANEETDGASGEESPDEDAAKGARGTPKLKQSSTGKTYSEREMRNQVQRELAAKEPTLRATIEAELRSAQELENAKASGELSKVIESQDKKIKALEPLVTEVEEWRRLAGVRFDEQFAKLPDSIKLFAPDDQASILEKERWLVEKALPALITLGSSDPVKGLSSKDDPKKKGRTQDDDLLAIRNGFAESGDYRSM